VDVEILDDAWCFRFGQETPFFQVTCPWRIRDQNCVRVGSDDHRAKFAAPAPLNARSEALLLFAKRKIITVTIAPLIADVTVEFEDNLWLDIFNGSASYEDWNGRAENGNRIVYLVAGSGGEIAIWDDLVKPNS
jgi:hypothetical protein